MRKLLIVIELFIFVFPFLRGYENNNYSHLTSKSESCYLKENSFLDDNSSLNYFDKLSHWINKGAKYIHEYEGKITALDVQGDSNNILDKNQSHGYGNSVYHQKNDGSFSFEINALENILIQFDLEYYSLTANVLPIEFEIKINNQIQYSEMSGVSIPTYWKSDNDDFIVDRYGNEILPTQSQVNKYFTYSLMDGARVSQEPLYFYLTKGTNVITINQISGEFLFGSLYYHGLQQIISYDKYIQNYSNEKIYDGIDTYEAEKIEIKNNASLQPSSSQDFSASPNYTVKRKINIISSDVFRNSGDSVTWSIEAKKSGLYNISFKAKQDKNKNAKSYFNILINNELPFEECKNISFSYSSKWKNYTICDDDNKGYLFYLEEGINTITLLSNASIMGENHNKLRKIIVNINNLGLDIKQLTGNNSDPNRDWDLEKYLPGVTKEIQDCKNIIQICYTKQRCEMSMTFLKKFHLNVMYKNILSKQRYVIV